MTERPFAPAEQRLLAVLPEQEGWHVLLSGPYGAYRYWHLSRSTAVWLIVFAVVGTVIFASLFVQNLGFIGGDVWVGPATPAN